MIRLALAAASALGVWVLSTAPVKERLRGVAAPGGRVAWASGAHGTVLRTTDGGAVWTRLAVPDASALDFRDVAAFDARRAFVLAIGPGDASRIYATEDGGRSWRRSFTSADPKAFWDAIAFWDAKKGIAAGDPVNGRFTVLRTGDGGATWTAVPAEGMPPALEGEGAFAASGTCLVTQGERNAWLGTGGAAKARVLRSTDGGASWAAAETPVAAGAASAGIFSVAFDDARRGVAVGGDYKKEREGGAIAAVTEDGGATWALARTPPRAFRSAVAYVPGSGGKRVLATGPSGTDQSSDGGLTWTPLSDEGFHALAVAPSGDAAFGAGETGRVGVLRLR
jgi:photosystem II stability/assembly factor-like uncharacterized protein